MAKGDFDHFFEKVSQNVDKKTKNILAMSGWMCKYLKHPVNIDKPWSFEHHEYQIDIVDCGSERVSIEKCSQVGASEVMIRIVLGLTARYTRHTTVYVFPTVGDLNHLVSHRVNTTIQDSPLLAGAINSDLNNNALKQIGQSFLYFIGSQKPAISIPANLVVSDETNFSNLVNVTTAYSRLGHNDKDNPGRFIEVSTPTLPDYGVSEGFNLSSQGHYMVKCDSCGKWSALNFLEDTTIPGYDDDIHDFRKEDLEVEAYKVKEAYFSCPKCKHELSPENMINPEKRQWVHLFPDKYKDHAGYHIEPQDVYYINPPSRTFKQLSEYKQYADWVNFKVGQPYINAADTLVNPVLCRRPAHKNGHRFMGVDVGKTSWIVVIEMDAQGNIIILHLESVQLKLIPNANTVTTTYRRAMEVKQEYRVTRFMVDSMPDLSLSTSLVSSSLNGTMSEYTINPIVVAGSRQLIFEKGDVTKVFRTGTFNELAKRLSRGTVSIVRDLTDIQLFKAHIGNTKKAVDHKGKETWLKLGPDHYAHALNYAICASGRVEAIKNTSIYDIPVQQTIGTAAVGSAQRKTPSGIVY